MRLGFFNIIFLQVGIMKLLLAIEHGFYQKLLKVEETADSLSSVATSCVTNNSVDAFGERVPRTAPGQSLFNAANRSVYMGNKKLFNTNTPM